MADAAYWTGYGVAFASVFSVVVLQELAPQCLKTGCREGANAGRKAAQEVAAELKHPALPTDPTAEPTGPASQPQGC
jgi:hypothetical protein